jgi:tetratricopeptide (TPR) repeat protein
MPLILERLAQGLTLWQAIACLFVGRTERAEQLFGRILQRRPDDAHALASRSHLRAQAGRHAAAIEDAQALVAAHPERSADDWFNLGFLLEAAGRAADAEPAFRRAVALDERLDRAWYGLALALIRLGRHEEAVVALEHNTRLQPMSPHGWYQLARLQVQRREPEAARRIIRHLQGFEPKVAAQLQRETGLAP